MSDEPTRQGIKRPVAAVAEPAPPVRKIGRFVIDGELGSGGMGVVLAGHDPDLDRKVAIKLLHEDDDEYSSSSGQARGRLMREAQAMARLRHPNVVTVHEAGTHDGKVYVAMEFVPGGTLRGWLEQRKLIGEGAEAPTATWQDVLAIFVPAGRGLAAAHAAGLVHRDFKPENVMVDDHGRVLVTDFGLAGLHGDGPRAVAPTEAADPGAAPSAAESTLMGGGPPEIVTARQVARAAAVDRGISERSSLAQTLTRTGDVMGTPRYMSPEQHQAAATDARTDQFAFCAALYEALFGVRAFAGDSYEVIRQHALEGVLAAPRPDRAVPERIADAVRRGLRPEADERWPSMEELLAELTPAPEPVVAPPPKRWPWIAGGVAVAAIAVALVILWPRDRPDPAAKQRAADRHAQACDCELITVVLPPGATLVGGDLQPTGQLALPRGDRVVEYQVDGTTHGYAVRAAGAGASRTLAVPAPEVRDGFVFVPGGDVPIGDLDGRGDTDEQPVALVHLEPYLIARRDTGTEVPYAEALGQARAAKARLPTAAEWEWAARRGLVEDMLTDRWEWTGTTYAPYPYADDGRDDALAEGDTMEVRGGKLGETADTSRPSRRLAGVRTAKAEVRLARTLSSVPPPREVAVRVIDHTSRPEPGIERTEAVIHPIDLATLHRFVGAWALEDDPPALQLQQADLAPWCPVMNALAVAGVARERIEVLPGTGAEARVVVRWNPVPGYTGEPVRCMVSSSEVQVMQRICFDGDRPRSASQLTIGAAATTLRSTPEITRVRVDVHVAPGTPDALALSQRRAEAVVAAMVAQGVAADRLVARGAGDAEPLAEAAPTDVAVDSRRALAGAFDGGDACVPGPGGASERVDFQVLDGR